MEQTPEIKQQRGNLLDKFIRNEKKAKLWAALSLLAFCVTASTVLVVAYQLKQGKGTVHTETPVQDIKSDTVQTIVITEDTSTIRIINEQAATIDLLTDSLHNIQVKYQDRLKEVNMYIGLWKECQAGQIKQPPNVVTPPAVVPPPRVPPLSVMIYTVRASADGLQRIKDIILKSAAAKNGVIFNTATAPLTNTNLQIKRIPAVIAKQDPATVETRTPSTATKQVTRMSTQPTQRYYAGIKYFDVKYANEAATIAYDLNKYSNIFANWQQLNVIKADVSATKADIEIWLVAVAVKTPVPG